MEPRYYCLVAGLHDISLDDGSPLPSFPNFVAELGPQLTHDDYTLLKFLRLPRDNRNLINLMENKGRPFEEGGNYGAEALESDLKCEDAIPSYLEIFFDAKRRNHPVYRNMSWEEQLNRLFYEETLRLPNRFLRDWFEFDLNFKNLLTALKCRESNLPLERRQRERLEAACTQVIIGENEVTESILASNAPDFDLHSLFPEVDALLAMKDADLVAREKVVDRLRWDWLSERSRFHEFDIETILTYCLKLEIAGRWDLLQEERGRKQFEDLLITMENVCTFEEEVAVGGAS